MVVGVIGVIAWREKWCELFGCGGAAFMEKVVAHICWPILQQFGVNLFKYFVWDLGNFNQKAFPHSNKLCKQGIDQLFGFLVAIKVS